MVNQLELAQTLRDLSQSGDLKRELDDNGTFSGLFANEQGAATLRGLGIEVTRLRGSHGQLQQFGQHLFMVKVTSRELFSEIALTDHIQGGVNAVAHLVKSAPRFDGSVTELGR